MRYALKVDTPLSTHNPPPGLLAFLSDKQRQASVSRFPLPENREGLSHTGGRLANPDRPLRLTPHALLLFVHRRRPVNKPGVV